MKKEETQKQIQIFKGWVMTEKGFNGREKLDFLLYLMFYIQNTVLNLRLKFFGRWEKTELASMSKK